MVHANGTNKAGRRLYSTGSPFEAQAGYSRALVDGEWVFVAGTTGFDYAAGTISDDPAEQTRQTLTNIAAALEAAGSALEDLVRIRIYITDVTEWPAMQPVLAETLAGITPPNTAIVCDLVDPRMKVEIEATARKRKV
ncbi:MAG: RidA family protein [Alphaproteobacteria bacterium]|nr:RidA family protein [Alphaproteobacteria bacterium]